MAINEESARKVIKFLLQDDEYNYRRWIPIIRNFNFEQIKNLLNGKNDENNSNIYNVSKPDIFNNLILKFENYSKIILKWYEKEDYYKYLKQLWINYICIEDINDENIIKTEQDLIKYLESNKIPYSQWPNDVKVEFKEAVNETICTYIHEKEFKDEFNRQHALLAQSYNSMKKYLDSFQNIFPDTDKESKNQCKLMENTLLSTIVGGVFSLIASGFIHTAKENINYKCFESYLVKQIIQYIPNKADAKKIAADIIINCRNQCGTLKWAIEQSGCWDVFCNYDGVTFLENCDNYNKKSLSLNLDGKESENISLLEKVKCVFKSQITCGLVAAASLLNLILSIKQFNDAQKLIEQISKSKNSYELDLKRIKTNFKNHLKELNLNGLNVYQFIDRINYFRDIIEKDKIELEYLLLKIKTDIERLKYKKNESIKGAVFSGFLAAFAGIGAVITSGGISAIYSLSAFGNLVPLATSVNTAHDCAVLIDELIKIQKETENEIKEIQKAIDNLNLKIKQKNCSLPTFYQEFNQVLEKQSEQFKINYF